MTSNEQIEKQASGIADAIVDLVERTDGPVTLSQIDREIPGFAANGPPTWEYFIEHADGKIIIWNQMTEAGFTALRKVIRGRRIAVQFVNALRYFLEDCFVDDERWWPIVLLPARAANLETPAFPLMRASQEYRDYCITRATAEGKTGNRLLTPESVRSTADRFTRL
jgi:hypothetical protein